MVAGPVSALPRRASQFRHRDRGKPGPNRADNVGLQERSEAHGQLRSCRRGVGQNQQGYLPGSAAPSFCAEILYPVHSAVNLSTAGRPCGSRRRRESSPIAQQPARPRPESGCALSLRGGSDCFQIAHGSPAGLGSSGASSSKEHRFLYPRLPYRKRTALRYNIISKGSNLNRTRQEGPDRLEATAPGGGSSRVSGIVSCDDFGRPSAVRA